MSETKTNTPPGIPKRHDVKPPVNKPPVLRNGTAPATEGRVVPADQVKTRTPIPPVDK